MYCGPKNCDTQYYQANFNFFILKNFEKILNVSRYIKKH